MKTCITTKSQRKEDGFTIVEVIVTMVVLSTFLFGFFQGYLVLNSQRVVVARQAHASDYAFSNLREISSRPGQITQSVCIANAGNMDLTSGSTQTKPGLDITAYLTVNLVPLTTLHQTLGSNATETLVAYAPQGCTKLMTTPLEIVSTVTFGNNGDKVTHATYLQ